MNINTDHALVVLINFLRKNKVYHLRQEAFFNFLKFVREGNEVICSFDEKRNSLVTIDGYKDLDSLARDPHTRCSSSCIMIDTYSGIALLREVNYNYLIKVERMTDTVNYINKILEVEEVKSLFGLACNKSLNEENNINKLTTYENEQVENYIKKYKFYINQEKISHGKLLNTFQGFEEREK